MKYGRKIIKYFSSKYAVYFLKSDRQIFRNENKIKGFFLKTKSCLLLIMKQIKYTFLQCDSEMVRMYVSTACRSIGHRFVELFNFGPCRGHFH